MENENKFKGKSIAELEALVFQINGKDYQMKSTRLKFSKMMELSAKLRVGLHLISDEKTGKTEMTLTEEYAPKELQTKVELIQILFALDIPIDDVPVEIWLDLLEVLDVAGFMRRLTSLSQKTS